MKKPRFDEKSCRQMRERPAPAAPFWRRRAKGRSDQGKGARRAIGGRGSARRPLAPETERVVTGGDGGGTQNRKPPPREPGAPQPLCKPLCGAPRKGRDVQACGTPETAWRRDGESARGGREP
ncbi:hypothetical protein D7X33_19275 [Butyricicoccus sp. 1XD8-22]|nr:hypothetical protein D7X33_19275 [Butyricicoccus sp. 1XD8-22]